MACAYYLAVHQGVEDILLVDAGMPLSLTSDKSTECYRNWWPGPGNAMVQMMNRSIDLIEELARENGNLFNLNRRGYLYVTLSPERVPVLDGFAEEASALGAGEIRRHSRMDGAYRTSPAEGFEDIPGGADLILSKEILSKYFPYLSGEAAAALHVRRAGWLSAQQYGMYMLEQARQHGVSLIQDRVTALGLSGGKVHTVQLAGGSEISTSVFVNAAGPMLAEVGQMLGVDIPVINELHLKAAINDSGAVLPREAPVVIFADEQELAWSEEEREYLSAEEDTRWLTEVLPSGAHTRPEGGLQAGSILLLWDTHNQPVDPVFPLPDDPMYAELAVRGISKLIPGMQNYVTRMPKPYLDGGYYTKTRENRPLASPLPVEGAYVIGAMSGYGIMASAGLGELAAKYICGDHLPGYAPAFNIERYNHPDYQALLENWGDSWQL